MTKKQKIWFWVFLGMFLIPEILWSPVGNFVFTFLQNTNQIRPLRNNFLINPDNINIYKIILLIQLMGLIFTAIAIFMRSNKKFLHWLILGILTILALITGFVLYFALTFSLDIL